MHPPPHFDKWFQLAQAKGVQMIDEYDTIYHSLLPFWALKPKTIRKRAHETLGFNNAVLGVLIRDGKVTLTEGGDEGHQWQREATADMIKNFVQYLPDMDLVFNLYDEPRVVVPSDDLQRMVTFAKDQAIPKAFQKQSPVDKWSDRPADLNKGDRIDEVRTTRFNRFAHQPTWTNSRASCPVDSPTRSLDESEPDKRDAYAHGELGFIYNTTAFSDICNTPSLRYKYGFFDRPNAFDVVHDLSQSFLKARSRAFKTSSTLAPGIGLIRCHMRSQRTKNGTRRRTNYTGGAQPLVAFLGQAVGGGNIDKYSSATSIIRAQPRFFSRTLMAIGSRRKSALAHIKTSLTSNSHTLANVTQTTVPLRKSILL
jgi:hypothetical protein